jgi:hypothetical protein
MSKVVAHQDEGALRDNVEVLLSRKLDDLDKPDEVLLQDPEVACKVERKGEQPRSLRVHV